MAANSPQMSRPFLEVHQEVRRLFDELIHQSWGRRTPLEISIWQPRVDIAETDETIIVEIELPGFRREDVQVEVEGDLLCVTGERRTVSERQGRNYHYVERSHGRFERQLRLPRSVDREGIKAEFIDGVLSLTLPKKTKSL